MNFAKRLWIIIFFGVGMGILILLASGLSEIQFLPGQPFFLSAEEQSLPLNELNFKSWNLVGLWKAFGYIILWVIFPLSIIYFIISSDVRKKVIQRAVTMGLTAYAFFFLLRQCRGVNPPKLLDVMQSSAAQDGENLTNANFSPEITQWLEWISNVLFITVLALAIWFVIRWWRNRSSTIQDLRAEASYALDELKAGTDLKDTVLRCYAEMSRILRQSQGIQRGKAMTPREFEQELTHYGFPGGEVRQLTRLFELARYGDTQLGEPEQRQALACLSAIVGTNREVG